ncbi:MAG: class I SAM-dependent methyltransferase [Microgenomates group bacterium]
METSGVLAPNGYEFFEVEDNPMLGSDNKKEEFVIKNRSFSDVDGYFSGGVSREIKKLLEENPNEQIRVLDLAGGTESQAVRDIEKEFGNSVKALNIDFAQNIEKGKGADRVQGDATHIPLADASIQIVYCRQLLPFMKRFSSEHGSQVNKVLAEVARILKPGGIAFLDDEEELSGTKSDNKRQELADKFGVILENYDSASLRKGDRNFPKFWDRGVRPAKFLVMKKL